ncbi:hypothetical protein [Chamaesiphon sp. GL140_3_metabinner_50]|uniref:hypothetical protein n=1 Tax=Chamaesiphon sp. GL140_3_metabinner_50 TaxID=2970812 RepID=UPI0025F1A69F|nr:hypothetical protein [Chamaesiphon sp. GL140_3_metabinner_50]
MQLSNLQARMVEIDRVQLRVSNRSVGSAESPPQTTSQPTSRRRNLKLDRFTRYYG